MKKLAMLQNNTVEEIKLTQPETDISRPTVQSTELNIKKKRKRTKNLTSNPEEVKLEEQLPEMVLERETPVINPEQLE